MMSNIEIYRKEVLSMEQITFNELTYEWLSCRRLYIKRSTFVKYEAVITKHIFPYFSAIPPKEIKSQTLMSFFELKIQQELSYSLLCSIKNILVSILEYGIENYSLRQMNFKQIRFASKVQAKAILSGSERNKIIRYTRKNRNSLSLAMLLALYGGLRLGEICALKWDDVDFDNQVIKVMGTAVRLKCFDTKDKKTELVILPPKSQASYREVPLSSFLSGYLKRYFDKKGRYLLSNSEKIYEPRRLERQFKSFCIGNDINCTFHGLRHSFATACVRSNVEIKALSEILGHSNVSITLNVYVHTSLEQKKREIEKLVTPDIIVD